MFNVVYISSVCFQIMGDLVSVLFEDVNRTTPIPECVVVDGPVVTYLELSHTGGTS